MYRSVVICPDLGLAARLDAALESTGYVTVARDIHEYSNTTDLVRILRATSAQILFLSFENIEKAQAIVKVLGSEAGHVQVVAVHGSPEPTVLRETMRLGLREFLWDPFERKSVMDALSHLKDLIEKRSENSDSTDQIFSFLPSKAGVGTSTIAVNVSAALARRPDNSVLLSDFDLNSGMVRFMLQLNNEFAVTDAVERAHELDEQLWPQLVSRVEGLDVLNAGKINPNYRVEPNALRELISFVRRNYKVLCFDMSGNLERYSIELMQESKAVLLVCTPEIPSLHLAREKLGFLKEMDLKDRTTVILNRVHKKPLFSPQQVEDLLGVPVTRVFPNDYHGVNRAVTAGSLIAPNSEMGRAFAEFASSLVEQKGREPREHKRKFLEFLTTQSRSSG